MVTSTIRKTVLLTISKSQITVKFLINLIEHSVGLFRSEMVSSQEY